MLARLTRHVEPIVQGQKNDFVAPIASRLPGAFRKRDAAHFRRAITGKIARRITNSNHDDRTGHP